MHAMILKDKQPQHTIGLDSSHHARVSSFNTIYLLFVDSVKTVIRRMVRVHVSLSHYVEYIDEREKCIDCHRAI